MPRGNPRIPEGEFVERFRQVGPMQLGRELGIEQPMIQKRRREIENRTGIQILGPNGNKRFVITKENPARIQLDVSDGIVLIGSDCHYWPGIITTAHRAFVKLAKELQPKVCVLNGDVLDGATISRFPPISWQDRPSLIQEIEACQERTHEIVSALPRHCKRIWTLGNHDGRFETRIASVAPEFARIHGVHLKDHFPEWEPCWAAWVNGDTVIKHRVRGGIHATRNNTIAAGMSIFTGHLHSLKVTPYSDYHGCRYGVDTGTMAEPNGPQFRDYLEDNPTDWRSGFVVATFHKGRLLWPEVVHVFGEGQVEFQGKVIEV